MGQKNHLIYRLNFAILPRRALVSVAYTLLTCAYSVLERHEFNGNYLDYARGSYSLFGGVS